MGEAAEYEAVLTFWCGELDDAGLAEPHVARQWWKQDRPFDDEIRNHFEATHRELLRGGHEDWLESARGRAAAIIVLDQFSRNMYRGTPEMYAADTRARTLALEGVARGQDRELPVDLRVFFYMPLMHCEEKKVQDHCVELFTRFVKELTGRARERVANNLEHAIRHRDDIARFGRFPYRNAILGRESTAEELEFLQK